MIGNPCADFEEFWILQTFVLTLLHFPFSLPRLKVRGELDTRIGEPSLLAASVRQFNQDVRFSWQPIHFLQVFVFLFIIVNQMQLSASAGLGVQYDKYKKLHYVGRGKMSFPVTTDGLLRFTIKGQSHLDKDFKQVSDE